MPPFNTTPDTAPAQPDIVAKADGIALRVLVSFVIIVIVSVSAFVLYFQATPSDFVSDTHVRIEKNASLSEAAAALEDAHVIRSKWLFKIAAFIFHGDHAMQAGNYVFVKPEDVWSVANRVARGDQGLTPLHITFPEGTSVRGMRDILAKSDLGTTTAAQFYKLASSSEGYLFPDTYLLLPNESAQNIVNAMQGTFKEKIEHYATEVMNSKRTLKDVIIMASIVEKEARTAKDRGIIAGILWKRIDSGHFLQVDAPFAYALGISTDKLTLKDLATTSPYNTYNRKGLPIGPINNPGAEAIEATLNPTYTPYWFYLSDSKGTVYYAATYEEHLANRRTHLGK